MSPLRIVFQTHWLIMKFKYKTTITTKCSTTTVQYIAVFTLSYLFSIETIHYNSECNLIYPYNYSYLFAQTVFLVNKQSSKQFVTFRSNRSYSLDQFDILFYVYYTIIIIYDCHSLDKLLPCSTDLSSLVLY